MATTEVTIKITQGDAEVLNFWVEDENGTKQDLTGSDVFFTVKANKTDADAEISIKQVGANGDNPIYLTAENTSIPIGTHYFDVQVVTAGNPITYLKGDLVISWQATVRTT